MIIFYLIVHLNMFLVSGSSNSDKVDQTPRDIFIKPGKDAKINCKHKIDNYDRILWYKQSNKQMQLLGYMYSTTSNTEKDVKVKMEGDASKGENCTLIIERVNQSSSAVYFCAASFHSSSLSQIVEQTPTHMFSKPGEKPQINCKHEIKDYNRMLWYKQLKNRQMQFLGYMNVKDGYPEDGVHVKIEGSALERQNCTLTIEAVELSMPPTIELQRLTTQPLIQASPAFISLTSINTPYPPPCFPRPLMLWYQQRNDGQPLTLIGFENGKSTPRYEGQFVKQFMLHASYLKVTQSDKLTYSVFIVKSCFYGAFVAFLLLKFQGAKQKN
ncbi:uncharacterized protein [Labrus bergylta]|uniref:uncharacterized protein n=1 Tax=Labrus bergylta TaxID=56723 RepID=UPI003313304D